MEPCHCFSLILLEAEDLATLDEHIQQIPGALDQGAEEGGKGSVPKGLDRFSFIRVPRSHRRGSKHRAAAAAAEPVLRVGGGVQRKPKEARSTAGHAPAAPPPLPRPSLSLCLRWVPAQRLVPAAAAAAPEPRPVAGVERRVEAEAGRHQGQAEQRQPARAQPPPPAAAAGAAATGLAAVAGAGVRVVPLGVGHAVVEHGVRQPHAADPPHAGAHGVRRVVAPPPPVVGHVEDAAAVFALGALQAVLLPPLPAVGGRRGGAGEEGARLGGDGGGEARVVPAAAAAARLAVHQGAEGGVGVRGRQRVGVVVLLLRLGEVDVGLGLVRLQEGVAHRGVPVVLVALEPGRVGRAAVVALGAPLPAALPRVDADDLLVLLEGDVARKPRQRLEGRAEGRGHAT
ncbi:hypothetical protein EYF80_060889 [Liparis tanakae]|uniref:Uncharacterized protein n=1 Tax=Liparis tanakae TaxID=230148 RepID=A0A4Z2EKS0_9TELE|nr:hypothetical protein EYF80_060889 [Liparis tanakae]